MYLGVIFMVTLKLIHKLSIVATVAVLSGFLNPEMGQATTLVRAVINEVDVNNSAAINACPKFLCEPGKVFLANNAGTPSSTLINNTNFVVAGISFEFVENQDAKWETGVSDLFSGIKISEDGRKISFTGGAIPTNKAAILTTESGSEVVNFFVKFDGETTSVPEPSFILGILVSATLGAGGAIKKKLASSKS
jgi:hypothetical protein